MATILSGIYIIKNNINNKCYIGSAKNFKARWYLHKKQLLNNIHHSILLQRAFNKYGDIFSYEIIELCQVDDLIKYEQKWFDLLKPQYNICKIAGSSLGIKRSDDFKKRVSENSKVPVLQFDKSDNFIKEFSGVREAMEITKAKHISKVCKGERKTSGGFIWKYKNNNNYKNNI
jgi:group I intron endonuclease